MASLITTHVLDTSRGRPAEGMSISLERLDSVGSWQEVGGGATDVDGRAPDLLPENPLVTGRYRIRFDTGLYYAGLGTSTLYPSVTVEFKVNNADEHYHVPLLLSPFGYSTYRGS